MGDRIWFQGELVRSAASVLAYVGQSLTQAPNWANPADAGDPDVAGAVEALAWAAKRAVEGTGHMAGVRARQAAEAEAAFSGLEADTAARAGRLGSRPGS